MAKAALAVALRSLVLACLVVEGALAGGTASPEGRWRTIDDRTGEPRAIVDVRLVQGQLQGRIERLCAREGQPADPVCTLCTGERRGQKVVGMLVLWGHRPKGAGWGGGRLFDPETAKEHRGRLWLEDPDTLKVRGYWGPLYRTQTWHRLREAHPEPCPEATAGGAANWSRAVVPAAAGLGQRQVLDRDGLEVRGQRRTGTVGKR